MSARFSTIEACVFDAYGTLFDVNAAAAHARDALGPKVDAVAEIWRQKQLQYSWLRSLMGAYVDFWQITGEALDFAMEATGTTDPELRARLMELYRTLDAYPEVPEVLASLKSAGLRCAILSNGSPDMLEAAAESAGIRERLDAILSVAEIGIFKTAPAAYQLAVDRLEVKPSGICFMSSNGWDAAGAAHFGFTVAWVNRLGQPRERLPGEPAAVISSLSELPSLLGLGS